MGCKNNAVSDILIDLVSILSFAKVLREIGRLQVGNNTFRIIPLPCYFNRSFIDIGCKNLDVAPEIKSFCNLMKQDRYGVSLFTRRATCGPYSDQLFIRGK